MSQAAPTTFSEYEAKYARATISTKHLAEVERVAKAIQSHESRYQIVGSTCEMPWWVVGCIHERESSLDFMTYLQNGDPLFHNGKAVGTVHVPHGVGPFKPQTWEAAAIRAMGGAHSHHGSPTSVGYWLSYMESYNGLGYRHRGVSSPYLWSFTNQYVSGHYIADGVYSAKAIDDNPGTAAIMKALGIK